MKSPSTEIDAPADPIPLNYAHPSPLQSSWPTALYLIALSWAFLSMYAYVAMSIAYKDDQIAQWRTQFALVTCAGLRLVWARYRRHQGRGWIFYVIALFLSPLAWALGVSYLR